MGIVVGLASAGFLVSLNWVTQIRENNLWLIAFLPVGGFAIGLLYHYYGKTVVSGNNLLIETIYQPQQIVPFKMAPFVYLGTLLTHILGGSAGREGTALQIAGAIAYQFVKPFKLTQSDIQILLIAAVAAGFGSVFGTPIAGAVFGLEIALFRKINYAAILPAFVSAIIANLVCNLWPVNHTHYHIDYVPSISVLNIFYSIIAGIAFGLCAASFSKIMLWATLKFKIIIKYAPLRPVFGGILIALAVCAVGNTKFIGLGIPTISLAFGQPLPVYYFALKMVFTIFTLSAGFKGGEVTPLFFIGATLGNALFFFIPLPLALLAAMGFVAVFAGATNTPLACTIMAIELFGMQSAVYVAISCEVAYLVSGKTGIYNSQKLNGIKLWVYKVFVG